jgi:hypothetical protein
MILPRLVGNGRRHEMRDNNHARQAIEPVYHRLRSRTQTLAVDVMMVASGEACGRSAWGSQLPTVQAYWGPLGPDDSGIEFVSAVIPELGSCTPSMAYWYASTPGVIVKPGGLVCIPITVTRLSR